MTDSARIVSLLPSATEIVCALGLGERLVGRSHECDHPESVRRLPVCTSPRFETTGTSREIDERVKHLVRDALSLYTVDASRLAALAPDLIVTQSQCDVCAVSLAEVEAAVAARLGTAAAVVSLSATDLAGIYDDIARVGAAARVVDEAEKLIDALRARVAAVRDAVSGRDRPRVLTLEWLDPLMSGGNWVPDLVDAAGGECLHSRSGEHSAWVEWEELVDLDPDVLVLMPCGFDMDRTRMEVGVLTGRDDWTALRAAREGRVFVTDGNQYFNRPGPRIVDSVEILAELLHPGSRTASHEGIGWSHVGSPGA